MDPNAPHSVDLHVPPAVLLSDHASDEAELAHPNQCGAVWYRAADPDSFVCDAHGAVQKWLPQQGLGVPAYPAKPNTGNLRHAPAGGLLFEREINSGLTIDNGLVETAYFSCAVRYSSDSGEARSLLTINPRDENTYLFLAEKEGQITWQDQQNQVALSLPAPKGGGWVVAGFSQGKLSMGIAATGQPFSEPLRTKSPVPELVRAFGGVSDIFIGCRSHRKGILKTLGSSRIHDVLLWIDQDSTVAERDVLNATCRYCASKEGAR